MNSDQHYETAIKMAAYKIVTILREFESNPQIKNQLINLTMRRVNRMLNGENVVIDGPGLTRVIDDPLEEAPKVDEVTKDPTAVDLKDSENKQS